MTPEEIDASPRICGAMVVVARLRVSCLVYSMENTKYHTFLVVTFPSTGSVCLALFLVVDGLDLSGLPIHWDDG